MLRIGIDTGGTFTDFVVLDKSEVSVFKIPSTPANPEIAVLEGLARVIEDQDKYSLQHGSTVATNAFLERKGARCVLVTNQGFEDVIEIGRQNRPGLFQLTSSRPKPLVGPRERIGIKERMLENGESLVSLEQKSLDWLKSKIEQLKPESVAVVLLYSYVNPKNELRIAESLRDLGVPLSLSHQILPEFREFERTSTTVINAYVQPIMSRYLSALESDPLVSKRGLSVMQSNGGAVASEIARSEPVHTLFSGPAGGVVGAFEVAKQAGYQNIITLDMGGTSTDVCLCDGRIETTNEASIDHHPVSIQMIGIHTVGAGGGSIARVDEGGLLKVGPESAGAVPGPLCYGTGREVTVTDANVFLGRLEPDFFLGGTMKLSPERIQPELDRLGSQLAKDSGRKWQAAEIAEGILRIANTQMERALRLISLERGYDTRDFTLLTFGGAGGLHACSLARSLMIPKVLIPSNPGALSALGIVRSDTVQDASLTVVLQSVDSNLQQKLKRYFSDLEQSVTDRLIQQGFAGDDIQLGRSIDGRYLGQSYEINVPYSDRVIQKFHQEHERLYGYANPQLTVEIVNVRVRGRARQELPEIPKHPNGGKAPNKGALVQEKQVILSGRSVQTKFFDRKSLKPGNTISGPAIILEYSATTLIPEDFRARIDPWRNILLESKQR